MICAENIAGVETVTLDYEMMPRATYSQPQVASFGLTEAQAAERGFDVKVGNFPFQANGKALGLGDYGGWVKLITDAKYGEILGAPNWVPAPDGRGTWVLVGSYDNILHCVDLATGQAVWTYETDNYVNGSPAVDGGRCVFGGCDALIHVVSLRDGAELAQIDSGSYIAASAAFVDGQVGADKLVVGDIEILPHLFELLSHLRRVILG